MTLQLLKVVLLMAVGASTTASGEVHFEDFAGSEACARCHEKQYRVWKESTHGRAGGAPGEVKMMARFDGQPMRFHDATVTPLVDAKGEYRFVVERSGAPKMEIKVDAVVGGGHMFGGGTQSFFHRFNDGTVRFLPFDFIRRENLWFVQLRRDMTWAPVGSELSLETDLANWPPRRVLGTLTEFSNCQNCHGSQITAQYDSTSRKYATRYKALNINCESCHGPGRRHIKIVSQPGAERLEDIGMQPLATLTKDQSLLVCFQCHASKDVIREDPYLPGASLESWFSLKLPQFQDTYTPDGRIHSFGYQGNHLYSDCYLNGSMTCVDCHDPHSQQYRDVTGKPLSGRFDNGQCIDCHASKGLASDTHSHHKLDSAGNLCTSCHMPFLQHQGVGMQLHFARSDHSIPIPRPAFDHQLGIENACQKCHPDRDLAWQEAKAREWYGQIKPHNPAVDSLLKAAATPDGKTAAALLVARSEKQPLAQASGLISFIKRFVHPNMDVEPLVVNQLKAFAESEDVDLKALGLTALHLGYTQQTEIRSFCAERLRRLGPSDPVRSRWAVAAGYCGDAWAEGGQIQNAIFGFKQSLEVQPDNVITLSHLALACQRSGDLPQALTALKKASSLQPARAVLHFQLALVYQQVRQIPEAIRELEAGLQFAPDDPAANRLLEQLRSKL